jgi:hypothetical protein
MRWALTEEEQQKVASAIVEHLETTKSNRGRRARGMGRG